MSKIIITHNRKGGVCKSTFTLNISHAIAEKGYKVLAIDLDDQQNTTKSISPIVKSDKTIEDLLLEEDISLGDVAVQTEWDNVWILPASSNLSGAIKYLDGEVGGHNILREKLRENDFFDYIVIDTSPSLSIMVINGLCASDYMFIPLSSKYFSMQGLQQTLSSFKKVTSRLNPDLKLLGIGFVCHDSRSVLANEVVTQIKAKFSNELLKSMVGINIKIEEAQVKKQSILSYAPDDRGSKQYRELVIELLSRIEGKEGVQEIEEVVQESRSLGEEKEEEKEEGRRKEKRYCLVKRGYLMSGKSVLDDNFFDNEGGGDIIDHITREQLKVDKIKEETDFLRLLDHLGIKTKITGKNIMALCPFHDDKTPSLAVYEVDKRFKCFGCDKKGDVVNFVEYYKGIKFIDALKYLDDFNMSLTEAQRTQREEKSKGKKVFDMPLQQGKKKAVEKEVVQESSSLGVQEKKKEEEKKKGTALLKGGI